MNVLYVALGGALGSALRYLVGLQAIRLFGVPAFPLATFFVNVVGSILLGVLLEVFSVRVGESPGIRLLLTTGVMGGFTTYSTFNFEVFRMVEVGQVGLAFGYLVGTVLVCFLGVWGGVLLVRMV